MPFWFCYIAGLCIILMEYVNFRPGICVIIAGICHFAAGISVKIVGICILLLEYVL